jgi:hypothetical protein
MLATLILVVPRLISSSLPEVDVGDDRRGRSSGSKTGGLDAGKQNLTVSANDAIIRKVVNDGMQLARDGEVPLVAEGKNTTSRLFHLTVVYKDAFGGFIIHSDHDNVMLYLLMVVIAIYTTGPKRGMTLLVNHSV